MDTPVTFQGILRENGEIYVQYKTAVSSVYVELHAQRNQMSDWLAYMGADRQYPINIPPETAVLIKKSDESNQVVDTGETIQVRMGNTVYLTGSVRIEDQSNLVYSWIFTKKPIQSEALIQNASTLHPSFVSDADGEYILELTVTSIGT